MAVDLVPKPDRISPPFPAMFSYMMLGTTPRGDAYTAREYEEMGGAAGFETVTICTANPGELHHVHVARSALIAPPGQHNPQIGNMAVQKLCRLRGTDQHDAETALAGF